MDFGGVNLFRIFGTLLLFEIVHITLDIKNTQKLHHY